jgi:RimJ/RimL family protein N-acetyltransferase
MSGEQLQPVEIRRAYPRQVSVGEGLQVRLRLMTSLDVQRVQGFARSLPERDLQFLRVDITRMLVVMQWTQNIKAGKTVTVLAEKDGELLGYASLHNDQVSWQRHLGELRVQMAEGWRGRGLGRVLAREIYAIAPEMGLQKIFAQVPTEQEHAIALLERAGFRQEAVLHDFVIDRSGRTKDLVVMTCDVAALPRPTA